jgi:hypothetical protein
MIALVLFFNFMYICFNLKEFVHGINIIPVTPATALLLDQNFVESEWPVLGYFLPGRITANLTNPVCSANPGIYLYPSF